MTRVRFLYGEDLGELTLNNFGILRPQYHTFINFLFSLLKHQASKNSQQVITMKLETQIRCFLDQSTISISHDHHENRELVTCPDLPAQPLQYVRHVFEPYRLKYEFA